MAFWNRKQDIERLEAQLEDARRDVESIRNEARTYESLAEALSAASSSGVNVTTQSALKSSSVYACVRLIAGAIASLPLHVYKRGEDSRDEAKDHPVNRVLSYQPNPLCSSMTYWEAVVAHILLAGDHFSLIGRKGANPDSLTPLNPRNVNVYEKDGRLRYDVSFDDAPRAVFDQDDILHIPGLGWDGCRGMSTIAYASQTIGLALATEEYSATFFKNGARPSGIIKFDKKMTREQIDLMREYWAKRHQGLNNAHMPAILTEGGDFKETSISAQDSQLLESRRFQVSDIARIFGVPPHMIGETDKATSWGSGIEQQSIGFIMYTLRPHLKRIEQEVNRKLFRTQMYFAEFNVSGLLRGDIKGRHEAYQIALGGNQQPGWMTVNEVRQKENLAPLSEGDELYKPLTGEENEERSNEADSGQPESSEEV